jgi:hypothetical protein
MRAYSKGLGVVLVLAMGAASTMLVGVGATGQAAVGASERALIAIAEELRLLRSAVQEANKSELETRALTVYLSAQQSRLVQLSTRLDTATAKRRAAEQDLAATGREAETAEADALRTTDSQRRALQQALLRELKQVMGDREEQVDELRKAEAEMLQSLQAEEARWIELLSKLEETIRR